MSKRFVPALVLAAVGLSAMISLGSENLPDKPFGQFAILPKAGQFILSPYYTYTRFKSFYDKDGDEVSIEWVDEDDFEQNDGMLATEYGLTRELAFDLTLGYCTAATRFADPNRDPHTVSGLMDTQIGMRYRFLDQIEENKWYVPTLVFRLGGIIEGTYETDDPYVPFPPGHGSSGLETRLLATQALGKSGFGLYGDVGWRWYFDAGVPQSVFGSVGVGQTVRFNWLINSVTANIGYRFNQPLGGDDLVYRGDHISNPPITILNPRPRELQEYNQFIEGGLGFTDRGGRRYQWFVQYNIGGENTGKKTVFGLYINFPLGGK